MLGETTGVISSTEYNGLQERLMHYMEDWSITWKTDETTECTVL